MRVLFLVGGYMEVPCKKKKGCGHDRKCPNRDTCHDWLEYVLKSKKERECNEHSKKKYK